ncbi:MAG TPA: phospholipase [Thermoanaerobaculia bacterium]|nr:phospholipase [Thermoanaerobaculia bacterium]
MTRTSEEQFIAATSQGRYLVDDTATDSENLLVGFHGYGENADIQLEVMRRIPGSDRWILCSVQGLHWFYNLKNQRIAASWMTSQGREEAIRHNIDYVRRVMDQVRSKHPAIRRIVYLGFSQGAAMAYRAAAHLPDRRSGVVVLGGDLPPDVAAGRPLELGAVLIGSGTLDQFYGEAKSTEDARRLTDAGVAVDLFQFDGGHEWSKQFLNRAGDWLTARLL